VENTWPAEEPNYFLFEFRSAMRPKGKTLLPSTTCYDFVHDSLRYFKGEKIDVDKALTLKRDYADMIASKVECTTEAEAKPYFVEMAKTLEATEKAQEGDWDELEKVLLPFLVNSRHIFTYWQGKYYKVRFLLFFLFFCI
jgi:hypothetical protein